MSKIFFIRHAQASFGQANYDELSPKGIQQSEALGKYLLEKNIRFDKIFTGPLVRQQHTLEIVNSVFKKEKRELPEAETLETLKEHEGTKAVVYAMPQLIQTVPHIKKLYDEIESDPKLMKRNTLLSFQYFMDEWSAGNIKVNGVQSWMDFRLEVRKGLQQLLNNISKGETVGVFTSGGPISSITAEALNIHDERRVAAMNFSIRNTSFSTFLYSKEQFNLLSFNELPHLDGDWVTFV